MRKPRPPGKRSAAQKKSANNGSDATEAPKSPNPAKAAAVSTVVKEAPEPGVVAEDPGVEYNQYTHFTASGKPERTVERMGHYMSWGGVFFWVFLVLLVAATIWYYFAVAIPRRGGEVHWLPAVPGSDGKRPSSDSYINEGSKESVKTAMGFIVGALVLAILFVLGSLLSKHRDMIKDRFKYRSVQAYETMRDIWEIIKERVRPPPPAKKKKKKKKQVPKPVPKPVLNNGGVINVSAGNAVNKLDLKNTGMAKIINGDMHQLVEFSNGDKFYAKAGSKMAALVGELKSEVRSGAPNDPFSQLRINMVMDKIDAYMATRPSDVLTQAQVEKLTKP